MGAFITHRLFSVSLRGALMFVMTWQQLVRSAYRPGSRFQIHGSEPEEEYRLGTGYVV